MVAKSILSIIEIVARRYEVSARVVQSNCRDARATKARTIAMYLAREMTGESFQNIARAFGGRHHTTVMSAVERVLESPELLAEANNYLTAEDFSATVNANRSAVLETLLSMRTKLESVLAEVDSALYYLKAEK